MSAVQLSVEKVRVLDLTLHSALSDLRQLVEVGIEELIHGAVFWKSSVTGNDPVAEFQEAAAAVGIADVLHQIRRDSKLGFQQMSFILLQIQEHQELTIAEHGLDCGRGQKVGDVLGDGRAEAAHLPDLTPYLLKISCRILIV